MKQFVKIMLISMLTAGAVFGVSALPIEKPVIHRLTLFPNPVHSGDELTCVVDFDPKGAEVIIEIRGASGELINYMSGGFNIEAVAGAPGTSYFIIARVRTETGTAEDSAVLKII